MATATFLSSVGNMRLFEFTSNDPVQESLYVSTGYLRNPFPETGVGSAVLYTGHMPNQVANITQWGSRIQSMAAGPLEHIRIPPLAIEGSLGTGKTHLLATMKRELERPNVATLHVNLTQKGASRLLLSRLLLDGLRVVGRDLAPTTLTAVPLLDLIQSTDKEGSSSLLDKLPDLDLQVLSRPIERILTAQGETRIDLAKTLGKWLVGAHTTPSQLSRLDLAGPIQGEGEPIVAIADLMKISHAANWVRTWYILIDQLEELWRPGVVGPASRAKFLTDVRDLVDLGLQGAPIATVLAWNTEVSLDAGAELKESYRALWQRLGEPTSIPGLSSGDVLPFARAYLDAAERNPEMVQVGEGNRRELFRKRLEASEPDVQERLAQNKEARLGHGRSTARGVLSAWRTTADALAPT